MNQAVIYCRVSSEKQISEGHGLESQEQRCKKFIEDKGWQHVQSFREEGVSGGILERPELKRLLVFITQNPGTKIVCDDQKRIARDLKVYLTIKESIKKYGCEIFFLNQNIDDNTAEGRFIESILAAAGQLEREQNAKAVRNKMEARMRAGYWVLQNPPGYRFGKVNGSKQIIKAEAADLIQEALESYASGRFDGQKRL